MVDMPRGVGGNDAVRVGLGEGRSPSPPLIRLSHSETEWDITLLSHVVELLNHVVEAIERRYSMNRLQMLSG